MNKLQKNGSITNHIFIPLQRYKNMICIHCHQAGVRKNAHTRTDK
jgi:hypothetical protein